MNTQAIIDLAKGFDAADVRYLIVGGYAVVAHGYVRFTADVDVVLDMNTENIVRAWGVLKELEYMPSVPVSAEQFSDPETRQRWIAEKGMMVLNFHHRTRPGNRVDLFVEEPFSFESVYEIRYLQEWSDGTRLPFVDLETLKTMKQEAGRAKDLLDLEQLEILS